MVFSLEDRILEFNSYYIVALSELLIKMLKKVQCILFETDNISDGQNPFFISHLYW